MSLKEALSSKRFVVTSEIYLPQDKSPEDYLEQIFNLWGRVDGIRFQPFAADAAVSDSLTLCRLLREKKFDPVFQVTTRDRNRLEIQDALVHASSVGVQNLLVFTQDYRVSGDSLQELMFFHVDMGKFFSVINGLQKGSDIHGKDLDAERTFFIGSGVDATAGAKVPDMELREMEQLAGGGAQYFITTPVFDVDQFAAFVKKVAPLGIPVIAEVIMLHTAMEARLLGRYGGVNIPEHLIQSLEKAPVKFDGSAKITLEIIDSLKHLCAGVHIAPFGWESKIGPLIQKIRR
jgi:methylenetetrahydrofolate reductase (NADPH)